MTPQQAEILCLARAKAQVISQVAGVKILSETLVKDAMMVAVLVNAQSYAWVKDVREVKWEQEQVQKRTDEPPGTLLRVHLKGLVALDPNRDEGFALKLVLNRSVYQSGDEMQITVQSGQDAHLTIFNILEDDKIAVLLPNRLKLDRLVKKGEMIRIPDPETMGSHRKLKLFNLSKNPSAREAILVIATKDDIDLVEKDFKEAVFAQFPKQTGLYRNVLKKLMAIAPARRALAVQYYEVTK